MPLMHERARYRAGSGVEIFVGTPDREIDVPIMQRQRHVADCVREIDPNRDPCFCADAVIFSMSNN